MLNNNVFYRLFVLIKVFQMELQGNACSVLAGSPPADLSLVLLMRLSRKNNGACMASAIGVFDLSLCKSLCK